MLIGLLLSMPNPDSRKVLFLLRHTPYSSNRPMETIESIIVAGIFEQRVTVLFKDDGVWQVVDKQDGSLNRGKTISKVLGALAEYGINELYVCEESLGARGLSMNDLRKDVKLLNTLAQQKLLANQEVVLND